MGSALGKMLCLVEGAVSVVEQMLDVVQPSQEEVGRRSAQSIHVVEVIEESGELAERLKVSVG